MIGFRATMAMVEQWRCEARACDAIAERDSRRHLDDRALEVDLAERAVIAMIDERRAEEGR